MRKFYAGFLAVFLVAFMGIQSNAQVSVTATAGTAGPTTYTTVKAAFDAVNAGTHQGAVTVSLTGNTTEAAAAILNASGTGSASYTSLVLKPGTGVTATITGGFPNAPLIGILGSNVTIDGSNDGSGSRNLTISASDTANITAISILSGGTLSNVTVKNTVIRDAFIGVSVTNASFQAGTFNNITIENNSFQKTVRGIFSVATVAANNGSINVLRNEINATGANANFNMGVYVQGSDGVVISGNRIGNFNSEESETDRGIWLATGTRNALIEKNAIDNLTHTDGEGYAGNGIFISAGTTSANIRIQNNMISRIGGDGWDVTSQYLLDNPLGIVLYGTSAAPLSGVSVYYNTINMTGNTLDNANAISAGLFVSGNVTGVNFRNNIIVNNVGRVGTTGIGAFGVFTLATASPFASISNNNYVVNPTGTGEKATGFFNNAIYSTLTSWQTAIGGDANSTTVVPVFVSVSDLRLVPASNTALDNTGTPIAGITDDFDGATRSATTPDVGAHEFSSGATCTNPVITTQPTAVTLCSGANATFTVVATGTNLTYQWRRDGNNIAGATSASYTVTGATSANAGSYTVVVSSGTCSVTSNAANLTVNAATAITTQPANVTTCLQQNATFTVAATGTNLTYQWRRDGNNIAGATSASYTVTNITAASAGQYSVVVTGTCGNVTSNNATLTVSGPCTAIPTVDADVTGIVLMPSVVNDQTTLRVNAVRATRITFNVVDMNGKVVMSFNSQVAAGQNDIPVRVGHLGAGTYQVMGQTQKGRLETVRMVKL